MVAPGVLNKAVLPVAGQYRRENFYNYWNDPKNKNTYSMGMEKTKQT